MSAPMIDTALLTRAVARGLITDEQSIALAGLSAEEDRANRRDAVHDSEQLRFITGFADIFVTIGLFLFLGTIAYFGGVGSIGSGIVVAVLAWALAEFFTRRRRMALPSIVLLAIFAASGFAATAVAFGATTLAPSERPLPLAAASLATVLLTALHYRRFAVPVTIAAGAAALIGACLALAFSVAPDGARAYRDALLFVSGIATFALAMRFDLADPLRQTRRTDIAFWLHLLAAPLIVHPVLARLATGSGGVSSGSAGLVLGVVLILALIAVVTDRRAILVSGLTYAGIAFGKLVRDVGLQNVALPLTLLALGAFILLLSAGWQPLRRAILSTLPPRVAARLPHPIGA